MLILGVLRIFFWHFNAHFRFFFRDFCFFFPRQKVRLYYSYSFHMFVVTCLTIILTSMIPNNILSEAIFRCLCSSLSTGHHCRHQVWITSVDKQCHYQGEVHKRFCLPPPSNANIWNELLEVLTQFTLGPFAIMVAAFFRPSRTDQIPQRVLHVTHFITLSPKRQNLLLKVCLFNNCLAHNPAIQKPNYCLLFCLQFHLLP